MSEEKKRENYFILLGIDPHKPWSDADFESQLLVKMSEWTKGQNNVLKKAQFKQNLDSVRDIKAVMLTEASRTIEAAEAVVRKAEIERDALTELVRRLDIFAAKGFISDEEADKIVIDFKDRLDEVTVRAEIKKKAQPDKRGEDKGIEPLDSMMMQNISRNLELFGKKNLYDFLGSPFTPPRTYGRSTRPEELIKAALDILDKNRQNAVKDAKLSASNELAGMAKNIFDPTKDLKPRYDLALANQNFNALDDEIKKLTVVTKVIYQQQFEKLVEYGAQLKIQPQRAAEYIIERGAKMGVSVQAVGYNAETKLTCVKCGTVNDDQPFCRKCSAPLKIDCPSCAKKVRVEDSVCSQCSFPVGNAVLVRDALADSKRLIDQGQQDSALDSLNFAAEAWSTIPPRALKDPLTLEITRQREALEKVVGVQRQRIKELRAALDDHRYYEARRLLNEIDASGKSPAYEEDRKKTTEVIRWVETELKKARELEQRGGDSVDLYQAVLRECRDSADARDALSKSPPLPASDLSAATAEKVVSLTWKASASKNVAYTIVRKANARPISAADGIIVARTNNTAYDDVKPVIGIPVFYAVYADREGVLAATSAALAQPVMVIAPVSNIRVKVSSEQVHLQWDAPENVSEVRVYRSTARPRPNTLTGDPLKPLDRTQIIDHGLTNGQTYYYTLVTVFQHHDGREVTSYGITTEVRPEEPPQPILEVSTEVQQNERGRELFLSWAAPIKGEVVVLQSTDKLPFQKGEVVPQGATAACGTFVPTSSNQLMIRPQNNAVLYLTPLVLFQNQAYVGKTVEYANLEDVSNLKYTRQSSEFQLRWDWVANSHKCIVVYCHDDYPSNPDAENCTRQEITKGQYDITGYFRIKNPTKRDHYIVVYAVLEEGSKRIVASGLSASARTRVSVDSLITLDYSIERKRSLFGKGSVTLSLTATGSGTLPAMRLVAKQGAQPIRKTDGEVILQIDPTDLTNASVMLTYSLDEFIRNQRYARLFLEDDDLYDARGGYIHLNHPPNTKASVF